jgi:hypothetical protein|nr:MAG TPA: hypothetical protein [Caudoviricetes sp.]
MNDSIVLYKLIKYIKTKNTHGKNELIDFITNIQADVNLEEYEYYKKERELHTKKGD